MYRKLFILLCTILRWITDMSVIHTFRHIRLCSMQFVQFMWLSKQHKSGFLHSISALRSARNRRVLKLLNHLCRVGMQRLSSICIWKQHAARPLECSAKLCCDHADHVAGLAAETSAFGGCTHQRHQQAGSEARPSPAGSCKRVWV